MHFSLLVAFLRSVLLNDYEKTNFYFDLSKERETKRWTGWNGTYNAKLQLGRSENNTNGTLQKQSSLEFTG